MIRQHRELKVYGLAATRLNIGIEELVSRLMVTMKDHSVKEIKTMIFIKECWVFLEVRKTISTLICTYH